MFNHYKTVFFLLLSILAFSVSAQKYAYEDSWSEAGFNLTKESQSGIHLVYSVDEFTMDAVSVKGTEMNAIHLPAALLPNDEGAPDLPGSGQFIAIPQGSVAKLNILSFRTDTPISILRLLQEYLSTATTARWSITKMRLFTHRMHSSLRNPSPSRKAQP